MLDATEALTFVRRNSVKRYNLNMTFRGFLKNNCHYKYFIYALAKVSLSAAAT